MHLFLQSKLFLRFPVLPSDSVSALFLLFSSPMASDKKMHAVQYAAYGGGAEGLKHVEIPIPLPKKDEVLLRIDAAAINPFDWKVQKGALRPFMPRKFPYTPVVDVAGEVVDVGSEVNSLKQGDKVVSLLNVLNGGGLAEYAVAPASLTTILPPTIPPSEAAGLPTAALTALQSLRYANINLNHPNQQPKNILITAASGGVGLFATQLAKLANNIHVTATCGSRNINLLKSLGADEVLDYKTPEGAALKSPSEKKYDAVIHCATGISWSVFKPNLAAEGKVIDITPTMQVMLTSILQKVSFCKKQIVPLLLSPQGKDLEFIVGLAEEGKLRTVIDSRYALEKAEEAWAKSMGGHATGKIIVEM